MEILSWLPRPDITISLDATTILERTGYIYIWLEDFTETNNEWSDRSTASAVVSHVINTGERFKNTVANN